MSAYSKLASPTATREVLDEFGLATKKRLGQNFLVSDATIGRILEMAELGEHDAVLEIGPGIGTLTCAMLPRCGALVAIEADHDLPSVLAATCAEGAGRMALIEGDAMRVSPTMIADALEGLQQTGVPTTPTKFVSNLPYQVAATLVLRLLGEMGSLDRAVVMVQAEVADRMAARPNTKAYGAYTAKLALVGEIVDRFEVGPRNFMPPPHVDSAVVRIDRKIACNPISGEALSAQELEHTRSVIDAAFAQRRKTIRNSMSSSGIDKAALDTALRAANIDPAARAETLRVGDFIRLSLALRGE